MSKRNPLNRKLLEEEQQAIGAIYKQYIDTFQDTTPQIIRGKTFVKSTTLYAENGNENNEKGQLYNPKPIIKYNKKEEPNRSQSTSPLTVKKREKKKSNLKALGDQLKMLQQDRQTRHVPKVEVPTIFTYEPDLGLSTNLFVSNLSPTTTEQQLIEIFGKYGALASVKIMWPRNDETARSSNCGFVAFMSRSDAERAMKGLQTRDDMRINWGKSVKLPPYPIHIPPELHDLYAPPPLSGLPFNAQTNSSTENDLSNTVVRVTIPFDRNTLMLIHRMVEFVIREGPEFEALIINMEANNPNFQFLTDFHSPAHTYYRWKLYSLLKGDTKNSWPMIPFRMYLNGSIWIPPKAPDYSEGMPKELLETGKRNTKLTDAQAGRLISVLRKVNPRRKSIASAMVFCLTHLDAIEDILELIVDSLRNATTNPVNKIARLYLLSDVLLNCTLKNVDVKFAEDSKEVMQEMRKTLKEIKEDKDRECYKTRVLRVLRAWITRKLFEMSFVMRLESIFLHDGEDDDNNSLIDEPLDGANLLKRSLHVSNTEHCQIIRDKIDMFN